MPTVVHFIDVGQGSMSLIECADGSKFVVDCNITEANKDRVLGYLARQIGWNTSLMAFICTHRDADHMRGVASLHGRFPIGRIWDSGYPGTSTDTPEYRDYMALRRSVGSRVIEKKTRDDRGRTRFRYLSAQDVRLAKNANAQGIVLKVEHRARDARVVRGSTMLPGDSDAATWRDGIVQDYATSDLSCDILLAGHHGSDTFFEISGSAQSQYTKHVVAMKPDMVIISVGENPYGHPGAKALRLYRQHATGANNGEKLYRTDEQGTMRLTLHDAGGWNPEAVNLSMPVEVRGLLQ